MSTLNVSNITDGTTTVGTSYVVNGSAKAYGRFILSSSPASVSETFNISSVTDNGTGDTTVTFSSSMGTSIYPIATACLGDIVGLLNSGSAGNFTASTARLIMCDSRNASVVDYNFGCFIVQGELA